MITYNLKLTDSNGLVEEFKEVSKFKVYQSRIYIWIGEMRNYTYSNKVYHFYQTKYLVRRSITKIDKIETEIVRS